MPKRTFPDCAVCGTALDPGGWRVWISAAIRVPVAVIRFLITFLGHGMLPGGSRPGWRTIRCRSCGNKQKIPR